MAIIEGSSARNPQHAFFGASGYRKTIRFALTPSGSAQRAIVRITCVDRLRRTLDAKAHKVQTVSYADARPDS
jgi:hypothetical protein